jgi:Beta-lactamase
MIKSCEGCRYESAKKRSSAFAYLLSPLRGCRTNDTEWCRDRRRSGQDHGPDPRQRHGCRGRRSREGRLCASLTKTVFAYTVMQLVDQGKLNLDTPIEADLDKPLPSYGPDPVFPDKYGPYKD